MSTILHETPDGRIIEYRRRPTDPSILDLEHRALRPDGNPYDERWYRVSDAHLLGLNLADTGILEFLESRR